MLSSIKNKSAALKVTEKLYIVLLLVIFGGIVLHAPISVGLGVLWPHYDLLIKSWKEILMLVAGVLALVILWRHRQLRILKEPLMLAIAAYALLHLLLVLLLWRGTQATMAGLMIDLRYILFFGLVYVAIRLYPQLKKAFLLTFIAGGLVVLVFAILQIFVLPADVLVNIGYSKTTIVPYLTVDLNQSYIRINSTLRGPNPLGAYAVIILTFVLAAVLKRKIPPMNRSRITAIVLLLGGVVALWASYSRSAIIAAVVGLGIVAIVSLSGKISRKVWIIGCVVLFALIGGLIAGRSNSFVSNVLLHDNPGSTSNIDSNAGHASSLQDGVARVIARPFGVGIGSTGSASLYTDNPLVIENQYLFTAHESGWLGLALFVGIYLMIMVKLWRHRQSYVALAVFASGVGLAVIGLLLPVWVDDTVSIIWWGLAAIAIGSMNMDYGLNNNKILKNNK